LRKISRCQILRLECTKIDFGWGSAPDPAGGADSAKLPQTSAGFKWPTSKVREGTEREKMEENGEGGKGEGGERRGWEGTPPSRIGKVKRWQP